MRRLQATGGRWYDRAQYRVFGWRETGLREPADWFDDRLRRP